MEAPLHKVCGTRHWSSEPCPAMKSSGGSSAVERSPSKVGVEGSTPSPRSNKSSPAKEHGAAGAAVLAAGVEPTDSAVSAKRGAGTKSTAVRKAPPVDTIPGAIFVAHVPDGSHLRTFGNHVIVAGPNQPASIVTKGGLVPIISPESQLKKGGRPKTVTDRKAYKADKAREYRKKKAQEAKP